MPHSDVAKPTWPLSRVGPTPDDACSPFSEEGPIGIVELRSCIPARAILDATWDGIIRSQQCAANTRLDEQSEFPEQCGDREGRGPR